MSKIKLMIGAAAWAGAAGAQVPPPRPEPMFDILTYPAPGAAVGCLEGAAQVRAGVAPPPSLERRPPPGTPVREGGPPPPIGDEDGSSAYQHTFNVTADGRVVGLRRTPEPTSTYDTRDHPVQAAIAAWRFAPGRAYTGCRYGPAPRRTPLESADRALVLSLMAQVRPGAGSAEVWRRSLPPGDCLRGKRPEPRVRVYPPTDVIPAQPGRGHWVVLEHDLDATGAPTAIRIATSSGSPELEAGARRALEQSRFEPGARQGCLATFSRRPADLTAPERPNLSTFVRPDDDCPNTEGRGDRVKLVDGALVYPRPFLDQHIEGWAVIRFDVASWGAIGPAEVVAAEPAAAFGQAAQNIVRGARAEPGPGWRGCLQHVLFKLAEPDEQFDFTRDLTLR